MLTWLKSRIRKWLLTEEELTPSTILECVIGGKRISYRITGICGSMLRGSSSEGERIIGPGVACSLGQYQQLWDHFTKDDTIEWVDEKPPESP